MNDVNNGLNEQDHALCGLEYVVTNVDSVVPVLLEGLAIFLENAVYPV